MNPTPANDPNLDNAAKPAEQHACGCVCDTRTVSWQTRMIVAAVIAIIVGGLLLRALTGSSEERSAEVGHAALSTSAAAIEPSVIQAPSPATVSQPPTMTVASSSGDAVDKVAETTAMGDDASTICGESIKSLAELNRKAMAMDGVFVFIAGNDSAKAANAAAIITKAAETIGANGIKVGLFTIAAGSPEYNNIAMQVPPPSVLAMVKGRGMQPVMSADISEEKLVQAFMVAASSGGGHGGGGCGPVGCSH